MTKRHRLLNLLIKMGTTLKKEALRLEFLTEEEFDKWVQPKNMTNSK